MTENLTRATERAVLLAKGDPAATARVVGAYVLGVERLRDHLAAAHGISRALTQDQDPVEVHDEAHLEGAGHEH